MALMRSVTDTTVSWAEQRQIPLAYQPSQTSTNDVAKSFALKEQEPVRIYLAAHQTAGRGRGAHHWLDTGAGESLLSTWSFQMDTAPQPIGAPRIGLALFQAASSVWPSLHWGLKAPNDLYLEGKKVAGLLIETVSSGGLFRMLVGLGLNVLNHPRSFAEATDLSQHTNVEEGDWFRFLDQLEHEFAKAVPECGHGELSREACEQLARALNANSAKPFTVQQVTPFGDIIHAGGKISWMDL